MGRQSDLFRIKSAKDVMQGVTQALASLHWPRLALLSKRAGRTTAAILGT